MIFFYEANDEGFSAEDAARAEGKSTFAARCCDWKGCGRNLISALVYTLITIVICIVVIFLMYTYLGVTDLPYLLSAVAVSSTAFQPVNAPILNSCTIASQLAGQCLLPCGSSSGCSWLVSSLSINVTLVIYIAALMSFVGWFIFSIYVGIGFVALPIDCINAFKYRPKPLSQSELLKQRKALRDRASELIKMCQDMGSKFIQFNEEVHSKKERRKAGKVNSTELNRFRVLVDLLEADLEKYQMSDPQYYRKYYNPFVPYFKFLFGIISIILTVCWLLQIILFMLLNPPVYGMFFIPQ
jgi:LMBR1 domain-containing protein 1